jgi:hypothetical protein
VEQSKEVSELVIVIVGWCIKLCILS